MKRACLLAAAAFAACAPGDFDRFHVSAIDLSASVDDLARPRDLSAGRDLAPGGGDLAPGDLATRVDFGSCDASQCAPGTVSACGQCGTRPCSNSCVYGACSPDSANCTCIAATTSCCFWPACSANGASCAGAADCCSGNCNSSGLCACAPAGTLLNYAAILRAPLACCSGSSGSTTVECQFKCF